MRKIHGLKLILIFLVLIMGGCAAPTRTIELTNLTQTKSIVRVETEGVVLHYQNESYWKEGQYSIILQNKAKFSADLIAKLVEDVSKHGEREEHVANADVEFNEEGKATVLRCDIEGAVRKSGSKYSATFFWLLRPLGLDFIDNDFEESEKGLCWEGLVDGIPTTVSVELPTIDGSVYKAWEHPIGHCHAHVWWENVP